MTTATQKLHSTLDFGNIDYWPRDGSIFCWRIFPKIKGGPLNNTIDNEGKVQQKENNEIDNVLKSEEDNGDLVKHEDSTKHIGV